MGRPTPVSRQGEGALEEEDPHQRRRRAPG